MQQIRSYFFGLRHSFVLCLFLLLALSGCAERNVAEDINQIEANEIVAVLNEHGISAVSDKATGGRGKYAVTVKSSLYPHAVSVLHRKGLPKAPSVISELFPQSSFIPSSRNVEAQRLDLALEARIEEALGEYPPIYSAEVVVNYNARKDGDDPGVALFLQQRNGLTIDVSRIEQAIRRVIPGLDEKSVIIEVQPQLSKGDSSSGAGVMSVDGEVFRIPLVPFLYFWKVPENDYNALALGLVLTLMFAIGLGLVLGYWYSFYKQSKHYFDNDLPELPELRSKAIKYERTNPPRELPEE